MFNYTEKSLSQNSFQFQIKEDGELLTFKAVIEYWKHSSEFRLFYNQILQVPFPAFFWENKAVSIDTLNQTYEFVIVGTNSFQGKNANDKPFGKYFIPDIEAVSFPNLGNNAQLVVPCPTLAEKEHYIHIASFIRNASENQIDAFWKLVGIELGRSINEEPIWLSTSGLGVYWLHVRLDQRPKYYTHRPYKSI